MSKEETKENPTDSMIDEEVEETSINAKHRPIALGNLIGGYAFAVASCERQGRDSAFGAEFWSF